MTEKRIVDGKPPQVGDEGDLVIPEPEIEVVTHPSITGNIKEDAHQILTQYFSNHGQEIFGLNKPNPVLLELIVKHAPDEFSFTPVKNSSTSCINNKLSLIKDPLSDDEIRDYLRREKGDFVADLDIYQDSKYLNSERFQGNVLPDLYRYVLLEKISFTNVFRYLLVMSVPKKLRALPTLALSKKKLDDEILLAGRSGVLEWMAENCIPTDNEYLDIAKEYGIKEILPAMEIILVANGQYRNKWNNR